MGYGVAWWSSGPFSHVSTVARGVEYESVIGKGVLKHYPQSFEGISITVLVDSRKLDKALEWLEGQVGKKYDVDGILRFIFPFIKHVDNHYFCSELQSEFAQRLDIIPYVDTYRITPFASFLLMIQRDFDYRNIRCIMRPLKTRKKI